jgi:hypothetical protein
MNIEKKYAHEEIEYGVSLPFTAYREPIVETGDHKQEGLKYSIDYGKSAGWKYI